MNAHSYALHDTSMFICRWRSFFHGKESRDAHQQTAASCLPLAEWPIDVVRDLIVQASGHNYAQSQLFRSQGHQTTYAPSETTILRGFGAVLSTPLSTQPDPRSLNRTLSEPDPRTHGFPTPSAIPILRFPRSPSGELGGVCGDAMWSCSRWPRQSTLAVCRPNMNPWKS
jgi:hypothetical protein